MSDKILIVDDDIDSLKLIGLMLQRHGYEVIAASAGQQALSKAASDHPDLIILDIMMPDMDGYEVCRRLREDANTRAIPIIMFTAKTLVDDKVAGFEAGADDYLTKPTHPAELASRVKAMLARSTKTPPDAPPPQGTTIGVLGVKGGVGTTTVALNLATALALEDNHPIIADFRLGVGSLGLSIGMGNITGMANILVKPPTEISPNAVEAEFVQHKSGMRALLSSAKPREAQTKYSSDSAITLINTLRSFGEPVVFDLGSGLQALTGRILREMDQLIVVVEPLGVTLVMARNLLHELDSLIPNTLLHIVIVNRSQTSFQIPWNDVEQALGKEIRTIISAAPEITHQAVQTSTPFVMGQPSSMVANQITKLAESITSAVKTPVGD